MAETLLVSGLEQARTQRPVHFYGEADDMSAERVKGVGFRHILRGFAPSWFIIQFWQSKVA